MEQCAKCGEVLTITHVCREPCERHDSYSDYPAPQNLAGYLKRGLQIGMARDRAIRATAIDPRALRYGFPTLGIVFLASNIAVRFDYFRIWPAVAVILDSALAAGITATGYLLAIALFHFAARLLLHGRGTYKGLLRPLLLATPVVLLQLLPTVGRIVAVWWRVAILMCVAEEVEGMRRLQAFVLSLCVNVLVLVILSLALGLVIDPQQAF